MSSSEVKQLKGQVYKSTGSWYHVKDEEGTIWDARIKGKMKIDSAITSTNPIAVGDWVHIDIEDQDTLKALITHVVARDNYIVRVSPHNKNQKHIIASNLDLALLVTTIAEPRTSTGFIDRFLITAEAYHIPCLIVINKVDLLKSKHEEVLEAWQEMYTAAGYTVVPLIATDDTSVAHVAQLLQGKTTLFSGHSGVGKSTLINKLLPGKELRTGAISEWSGKGLHTTTFAEMFDLPQGGKIIDTPGVKEFGIIDFKKEELAHYFPEMRRLMQQCKYNNCLHVNEPACAIKDAVNTGEIAIDRYVGYRSILDSIEEKW